MSQNTKERALEPFFSTKSSGTGLGLSIVHSIVHAHAAELQIDSEEHIGTTMKIRMRLK